MSSDKKSCLPCPSNCAVCVKDGNHTMCLTCDSGSTWWEEKCQLCAPNCKTCAISGPRKCDSGQCRPGYIFISSSQTCERCPSNCLSCSMDDTGIKTCSNCASLHCYAKGFIM
ncbi:hypothetical protein LSAT2_022981 [Lamellibrachia satsuma]|nr:hypothetical protein LSAT2_022981 [Lamellibrachia satsuma]